MARKKRNPKAIKPGEFGPIYPSLTGMNKYRNGPSLSERSIEDVREYGRAVHAKVNRMNELQGKKAPPIKCPCAGGTWESDGAKILEAVRRQNRNY